MTGVPGASLLTDVGITLIDTTYSREQEREADELGLRYMVAAGYGPQGAIRLQESLLEASGSTPLPFLSSHPTGQERIENLRALISASSAGSETGRHDM